MSWIAYLEWQSRRLGVDFDVHIQLGGLFLGNRSDWPRMLKRGDMIPKYLQSAAHKLTKRTFGFIAEGMIAHLVAFWQIQYLLISVES